MNRIEAVYNHSLYSAGEHLDIRIDGEILTSYLNRKFSPRGRMNSIAAFLMQKFPQNGWITSFANFLNRKYSNRDLVALVPTLLDWLSDEEERKIVWERILPNVGKSTVAPILMCPDDCDFFCILIVVEIERTEEFVFWKRFGRDDSEITVSSLSNIGSKVRWFSDPEEHRFPIRDYTEFLNRFKREL
ncbi:hypothetical protein [Leptospira yasudae]|uniref:hypothetical protein n=1 Tax=Leptospira yasudae TaxID=2202201 RepID=UPI001090F321|nr:hypothetical protein [Leptospira yasudae]TGM95721.1 hypothetical protein EHR10_18445 [Leptospira yasudae]